MRQVQQSQRLTWIVKSFILSLVLAGTLALAILPSAVQAQQADDSFGIDWGDFGDVQTENTPDQPDEQSKPGFLDKLQWGGYLKNETAYRYDEPRSITKIRNILYLNADYPVSGQNNLHFAGWVYYDLAYDLFDYETIAARFARDSDKPLVFVQTLSQKKDSPVAQIRELYLDLFTDNMDVRLGKQFVIWGVFDGIRVTDEINPLDFRELVLPDLLDYRIPLWTAKVDYYQDQGSWEFLWIPDIRFHKPAPAGSEWELLQKVTNTTFPDNYRLRNSEYGIKYTTTFWDAQWAFSYFYTWDDFPVVFRTVKIDSSVEPEFYPTYTRINIFGSTFVKQIGPTVVKAELAYVPDKYFGLARDIDRNNDGYLDYDGELQREHYRWSLGIDFNHWGADFSPAITQWIIKNYDKGLIQDEFDTSLTLFVRKPLPEKSAVFQLLVISLVNMHELYLKPKISFDITDRFNIALGMDLFDGTRSTFGVSSVGGTVASLNAVEQSAQFFGNFHNNDRVFAEFKYTF